MRKEIFAPVTPSASKTLALMVTVVKYGQSLQPLASGQFMSLLDSVMLVMLGPVFTVGLGWITTTVSLAVTGPPCPSALSSNSLVAVGHLSLESGALPTPSPSKKMAVGASTRQVKRTHSPLVIWLLLTSKEVILTGCGVAVGARGVEVGGMRVDVGGMGVDVGGTRVPVGVGGAVVGVGGSSVDVGVAVGISSSPVVGVGTSPVTLTVTGSDWAMAPSWP